MANNSAIEALAALDRAGQQKKLEAKIVRELQDITRRGYLHPEDALLLRLKITELLPGYTPRQQVAVIKRLLTERRVA